MNFKGQKYIHKDGIQIRKSSGLAILSKNGSILLEDLISHTNDCMYRKLMSTITEQYLRHLMHYLAIGTLFLLDLAYYTKQSVSF